MNSLRVRTKNAPSVEADIPTSAVLALSLQCGRQLRADTVEKLRISDITIFWQKLIMTIGQMKSFMRRSELAHERQETNLAEPLATKSWSPCAARYFIDRVKTGVFQHKQSTLSDVTL